MQHLEIEVKFLPADIEAVRSRIVETGAENKGRLFEANTVYDTGQKRLRQQNALLRLRKDRRTTLTFKSPTVAPDADCKILSESEVEVSDFDTMEQILLSMGYHRQFVYEKWRETFDLGDTHLCLDCLPYGDFIEIEGTRDRIRKISERIGLEWHHRILLNYHEIFGIIRREWNLPFTDITFTNFKEIEIDPETVRSLLVAD